MSLELKDNPLKNIHPEEIFRDFSPEFDWSTVFHQHEGEENATFKKRTFYNRTPIHQDCGNWLFQVSGEKRMVFYSDTKTNRELHMGDTLLNENSRTRKIRDSGGIEGILGEGDLIIFPSRWLHEFWTTPNSFPLQIQCSIFIIYLIV